MQRIPNTEKIVVKSITIPEEQAKRVQRHAEDFNERGGRPNFSMALSTILGLGIDQLSRIGKTNTTSS